MPTLFAAMLDAHARSRSAHPAIAMPGRDIGYPELVQRVRNCAAWLVAAGCRTPDPVAVSVNDDSTNLITSIALLVLGIPQIALPPSDPAAMRRQLARRLSLAHVIVDGPDGGVDGIDTIVIAPAVVSDDSPPPRVDPVRSDDDAPALYATSSGTTGLPKLVAQSQRLMRERAASVARAQGYAADERVMVAMPVVSHVSKWQRLNALWHGATAIVHAPPPSARLALPVFCANLRVSYLQMTVLQARNLLLASDGGSRLPSTTRVFLGAARMPPGFVRAFESRVGARVFDRYGTSEANLIATTWPHGDDGTPDGVGRPVAGVDVQVVDGLGRPVAPGETGEIRVRSPFMVDGYVDDAVATAALFRNGWFHPGDMGSLTRDGVLRYLGRKDDMMVLNGINIFPAEIERVLEEHPAVRHAAAFPVESPIYGDVPVAAVELNGVVDADAAMLTSYARERLGMRAPRRIVIVEVLPRNAAGKVVKHELAASLARGNVHR